MNRNATENATKFLAEVDQMVNSIESESGKRLFAEVDDGPGPEDLRRAGAQALENMVEHSHDGACDLEVSDDKMTATATFYPPAGAGKPFELDAFVQMLDKQGITSGRLFPARFQKSF